MSTWMHGSCVHLAGGTDREAGAIMGHGEWLQLLGPGTATATTPKSKHKRARTRMNTCTCIIPQNNRCICRGGNGGQLAATTTSPRATLRQRRAPQNSLQDDAPLIHARTASCSHHTHRPRTSSRATTTASVQSFRFRTILGQPTYWTKQRGRAGGTAAQGDGWRHSPGLSAD